MKRLTVLATLAAISFVHAGSAHAQLPGIPVYNTPIPSGFAVGLDVGFPSSSTSLGTSYAFSAAFGTGPFGFTGSFGGTRIEATSTSRVTVGGTANWKVFGGPLVPLAVNLQAGVAFWQGASSSDNLRVPVGVGVMLTIPTPGMAIKPWVAPRYDYSRVSAGGSSTSASEFGLGLGLDLAFLNGLGVRAAYDAVFADGTTLSTIGVGVTYALRKPGS